MTNNSNQPRKFDVVKGNNIAPAVNQLHTLNISNNCISHQMVKKLYELNCRLIADKQEDDFEQGCGRSRYYALHE